MTDRIRLRQLSALNYFDPRAVLVEMRKLEPEVAASPTPEKIKTLRTNMLKPAREGRDAAIFAVGMSEVLGLPVFVAPVEDEDFDFVAKWTEGDVENFCRVQLKEVVAEELNPGASAQAIIDKLKGYADLVDIAIAIKLNREGRFDPADVAVPDGLKVGSLWVFGALTPDQSEFGIWGNFAQGAANVSGRRYSYPE